MERPGAVAEAIVEVPRSIPGKGTVAGVVVGATSGEPIAETRVAVYSRGAGLGEQLTEVRRPLPPHQKLVHKRQVEGAKVALQHNLGLGGACVVTLYGRG